MYLLFREGVMPFRMGPWEIALIVVIIMIVFGVGKLPQVGGAIGKGMRAFRKAQSGGEDEEEPIEQQRKAVEKTTVNRTKRLPS